MLRIGIFALMLVVAVSSDAQSQSSGNLPITLREHAASIGCTEVKEFYDVPGRIDPPYVFGYRQAEDEWSAVYYCEPDVTVDTARYVASRLVIWFADHLDESAPCEPLDWINGAAGLSLWHETKLSLNSFYVVDMDRTWPFDSPPDRGPDGEYTDGPIIRSYYDGVEELFYCHQGRWLVRQSH